MKTSFHLLLSVISLLPSWTYAGAFLAPICTEKPTTPTLAIYTTDHARDCVLHAAVYPDGTLMWTTEEYRKFSWPEPFVQSDTDLSSIYDVKVAQIDPAEVATLVQQIRNRKPIQQYLEHPFGIPKNFTTQNIVFVDQGEHVAMASGHEFPADLVLLRITNPDATPIPPTPEQQVFLDDWDFVKGLLFDLVDLHAEDGVVVPEMHFKQRVLP